MTKLAALPPPEPNADAIAFAEKLVADLKSGEVVGFVAVRQSKDGSAQYTVAGITARFSVLGYLSHLMYRLQRDE